MQPKPHIPELLAEVSKAIFASNTNFLTHYMRKDFNF